MGIREILEIVFYCFVGAIFIGFLTMLFVWWWTSTLKSPDTQKYVEEIHKHQYWKK